MVKRSPLLPGDGSAQDQLRLIVGICGKPKEEEVLHFPDTPEKRYLLSHQEGLAFSLDELFQSEPNYNSTEFFPLKQFCQQLLVFHPNNRLTAEHAFEHPFLEPLNSKSENHVMSPFKDIEHHGEKLSPEKWKELLWEEVMFYQNERNAETGADKNDLCS